MHVTTPQFEGHVASGVDAAIGFAHPIGDQQCAALFAMTTATLWEKRFGLSYHPITSNLVQYAAGALGTLPIAYATETMHIVWTWQFIAILAYLVVAISFVSITLLLAMMPSAGAVMTLPPIAGFLLPIGMGVDSNVLIFERIKEELAAGKTPKAAVTAGFDRVFWTIVDTHVASLISAAFLFQFGTGPIRVFATTLTIGLLSNVFTAVFVSRAMFELFQSRREQPAQMSI